MEKDKSLSNTFPTFLAFGPSIKRKEYKKANDDKSMVDKEFQEEIFCQKNKIDGNVRRSLGIDQTG